MKKFLWLAVLAAVVSDGSAQFLLNVDFGVGTISRKSGFAATGEGTNDFWNLYRHYDPRYVAGSPVVPDGTLHGLKFADHSAAPVSLAVTNAPGVWGNATGDPMYDSYIYAPNGSNITVTVHGLETGQYHLYLYGHADPDVIGEQNSVFTVRSGTNVLGRWRPVARRDGRRRRSGGRRPATPWSAICRL